MTEIISLPDKRSAKIDREIDRLALEGAALVAQRGDVAMTEVRYKRASRFYRAAAERVPIGPQHDPIRNHYRAQAEHADQCLARWQRLALTLHSNDP